MVQRYNIYYAGEILDGHDSSAVRAALAKLFNAGEETMDKLFSGSAQMIKRECDRATALKYKQAMERAGARPLVKLVEEVEAPPSSAAEAQSTAEKIAALAAAPDAGTCTGSPASTAGTATQESAPGRESLGLCPDGTEVLRPEERAAPVQAHIDTSALEVDMSADRLSTEPPPLSAAPDTSHLSMGEVGDTIPTLPPEQESLHPDTSGISLAPEGTDFSDCMPPEATPPELDLSDIELAPPGTDVLRENERRRDPNQPPPDTNHIGLVD